MYILKHLTVCSKSNEEELAKIEATRQYALENAGDMEVLDAMFAKARLLAKIGDPASAFIAYDAILNKEKITTGRKIDAMMEKARVAFFAMVSLCHYMDLTFAGHRQIKDTYRRRQAFK